MGGGGGVFIWIQDTGSVLERNFCKGQEDKKSWKKHVYFISGREWTDWSQELRVPGDEIRWQFTSDGSVNGWGWLFTVYPIMPAAAPMDMLSDRTVLSRPSIDLVTCLLGFNLQLNLDKNIVARLAAALAACAQLSSLGKLNSSVETIYRSSHLSARI